MKVSIQRVVVIALLLASIGAQQSTPAAASVRHTRTATRAPITHEHVRLLLLMVVEAALARPARLQLPVRERPAAAAGDAGHLRLRHRQQVRGQPADRHASQALHAGSPRHDRARRAHRGPCRPPRLHRQLGGHRSRDPDGQEALLQPAPADARQRRARGQQRRRPLQAVDQLQGLGHDPVDQPHRRRPRVPAPPLRARLGVRPDASRSDSRSCGREAASIRTRC